MTTRRRAPKGAKAPTQGIARVFWSGRSQAVRLPKEFRVEDRDLLIARRGKALVLEPRRHAVDAKGWPKTFWKVFGGLPEDFDIGDRSAPAERHSPLTEE